MDQPLALPGVAVVVLGAGLGTRMKSALPKVLHPVAGRPMVNHVLAAAAELAPERTVVVVGPGMDNLVSAVAPALTALQENPLGTAHAVLAARQALDGFPSGKGPADVVIVFGDAAMIGARTLHDLVAARRAGDAAIAVLGVRVPGENRYGRLVTGPDGDLERIVEFREARDVDKAINLYNSGMMSIDAHVMFELLDAVDNDNAKGEFYLTDIVRISRARGRRSTVLEIDDPEDLVGADDRADLARFEAAMQRRLRVRAMAEGASLAAPETVFLSWDTRIGRDVTIEPHVVIAPGVTIADNVVIRSFSHLEGASVGEGATVGPYARLRPGARIGVDAHIGNFVEIKNATVEAGAKANHLSYIGDARVGAGANIGAGTITCNYDGYLKHHTDIGAGAFIGSNTALVAPVRVGDRAIVGAGSTISRDVPADAVVVERSEQVVREGRAVSLRQAKAAEKARIKKEGR
ncbi:MAG: bifunctional UDP-N-acetylglucosamine diphosphorylase/glucosamine-1-phosphate N-acetyltransferase GlmU [Proteobacteria bacterium]|nr:bifunctional UDP-N-acetylglucosamine diphosphorylase/glucosamine-1-phosphate N-acetyltransferase GlmU [Pseudomonadota bacterium]MDA1070467.1 bifunctional UDP-N-acetylglucosamine diphosphorylase/glucosamine-1-phosphate N-acetyltransferase GlmU [Pseudomonadota bacterium]